MTSYLVKLLPALLFRFLFPWQETFAAGFLLVPSECFDHRRLGDRPRARPDHAGDQLGARPGRRRDLHPLAILLQTGADPESVERSGICWSEPIRSPVSARGSPTRGVISSAGTRLASTARARRLPAVVHGAPDDEEVLRRAGAATIPRPGRRLERSRDRPRTTAIAKRTFQVPSVIARADQAELVSRLKELGCTSSDLARHGAQPRRSAAFSRGALDAARPVGRPGSDAAQQPSLLGRLRCREVHLPAGSLVLGIRRRGGLKVLVPYGDTLLRGRRRPDALRTPEALTEAGRFLGGR
ncbi:MAG: hypothetical protein R2862_01160 [Thermoanaerobaculia bacterium]